MLGETNLLKPKSIIIIEAITITRVNSDKNMRAWLKIPRRFLCELKILFIARIIDWKSFRAIHTIHTPRKISTT